MIQCTKPDWKTEVFAALGCRDAPPRALEYVLNTAQYALAARTAVIEPYVSTDWADEYQARYARSFREVPRRARRIHFFRGIGEKRRGLNRADLLELDERLTDDRTLYGGYCVIRPFKPGSVGETMLRAPEAPEKRTPCTAEFVAHLLGHDLRVRAMPFLQQDPDVTVCAESNLWMLARYLNAKRETRRYRPSEMHKMATRAAPHGPSREGLLGAQMFGAMKEMNLNPDLIRPGTATDAIRLLYTYLESRIPVIAAVGKPRPRHVYCVIGYTLGNEDNGFGLEDSKASLINGFIAHDDETGPYRVMRIRDEETGDAPESMLLLDGQPVHWCLFAVPPRVHLREDDVRVISKAWIEAEMRNLLSEYLEPSAFWTQEALDSLQTTAFLCRSDWFKRRLRLQLGRSPETTAYYWSLLLPRNVWVVEFSRRGEDRDKVVGEMVLDPTAHPRDVLNSLLAFHLEGRLLYRTADPLSSAPPMEDTRGWVFVEDLDPDPYTTLTVRPT